MPSWIPDAIVYSVMPDRLEPPRDEELAGYAREVFEPWDAPPAPRVYKGGNLWGVARHLDRLVDLGVTALLLTPVTASASYHRYKPLDLQMVDPLLGGEAAFDALLDAAHRRGLRVVGDLVVNHVGLGSRPFADVVEHGARSPYRDWFHIERFPVTPHVEGDPGYRAWNRNPSMPVLNHANPAARAWVVAAAERWARRGLDGLRLDAAGEVEVPALFDEIAAAVKRFNSDFYICGEIWTDPAAVLEARRWDGATNYPLAFAIREFVVRGGIDAAELARRLELLLARHAAQQLNFFESHDIARVAREDVELAATLLFTLPGAPCVYYGAEVGLEGGAPPDNRRGFPASDRWRPESLALHRRLIDLRRAHPALRSGAFEPVSSEGRTLAFLRRDADEAILVAVNAGEAPSRVGDVDLAPRSAAIVARPGRTALTPRPLGLHVVVVGNIGIDTNVYLPGASHTGVLESAFTDDLDTIGQAGGYSSFGHAALGRRTGFIGHVGDDALGRWIDAELADAGIARLLGTDPAGTMRSVNLMARDGTRKNFYDGKSHMTLVPDLDRCRRFLEGARLAMFHLPNWGRRLLPIARELGCVIACDLQDMTTVDDPYRADFIRASDFLFCSAVNLDPRALSTALRERNPRAVIVLGLGARGAALHDAAGYRVFPPVELELPIVDTNGAGDSLAAGFLSAHVLDGRPVEEAMRWGQTAARWACTRRAKWRHLITREQLGR